LLDVMKSLNSNTPDETLLAIEECLNDFIESVPLGDDLTMLAIRRV